MNRRQISPLVLVALLLCGFARGSDRWTQFRGDRMDGIATTTHPERWSNTQNVAWSVEIPGEGWSCPVVWDDKLFLTSAVPVTPSNADATKPEEYRGGGGRRRDDLTRVTYRFQVMCLSAVSGEMLWSKTVRESRPNMGRHSSNTYATETPVTDGKFVYAYFGMHGLYCLDFQGNTIWETDLGSYDMRAGWGTSSSPVLFDDKLFIQVDNEEQSFVVAIDSKTGEEIWRVNREEGSQYSSPIIWQNSLRDELIVGGMYYRSYDPDTGRLLWKLDMRKGRSSATPLAVGDRLYVGTEFRNRGGADDGGGYLFAIKPGGSGDISLEGDATRSEFIAWSNDRSGIQMASPALCNGHLYLLERRSGVVQCLDAETGESVYRSRIPGARAFWASPWTSGDKVYCIDTSGTTCVLSSGDEFRQLWQNEIDEQTWSTPAIAEGSVYFRTISRLYRIASE